ncbi:MAG: hypothetical protein OXD54_05200 [Candidatus Poribacteria bacterium]|nr:hypothetical protein [Candidatus Poribacteria bacterium]
MINLLLNLKKTHKKVSNCYRYPILQISVISILFMFLVISCGPLPPGEYNVPETTNTTAEKTTNTQATPTTVNLPATATVDMKKLPYFRNAYKQPPRVRDRRALANFHLRMREIGQNSAIVTNCTFDILKAFVANGLPPIVTIQLENSSTFISPMVHYDNNSKMVHLQNPNSESKRRLSYEEFEAAWDKNTTKKCMILTPRKLNKADVQSVLGKYLPANASQQINVNTR